MKVLKIMSVVLVLALLAGPARAQLTFNWVADPSTPALRANATDPKLGADGTVAWTTGPGRTATYNGSLNDFTFTTLALPDGTVDGGPVTQVNSLCVPNSNGYYVVGKHIAAPDPMNNAWAYTSVGWTRLHNLSVAHTVTDSNEDYAVMHTQNGYGGVRTVDLTVAGAAVSTALPNQVVSEAGNGKISDNGLYISHHSGGGSEARISYGAGWASYTDLTTDLNWAYDVNNSGNVVGYKDGSGPIFYNFGTSTASAIPEGPFTGKTLRPKYINNLNQVVGTVNGTEDLFYYDYATDTTINLWDIVDGETGDGTADQHPPNWINWNAALYIGGINDDGWIAGTATGEMPWGGGGPHMNAFLLTTEFVPPVPKNRGDVTEDLFVGADDLVRILTHWGESGPAVTWSDGDCAPYGDGITTGDQFVGADDYVEVLSMWGTSYPAEPTPTPEPATLGLLLLGGLLGIVRRK